MVLILLPRLLRVASLLSTPDLRDLPDMFRAFFSRAVNNILTGHFYTVTLNVSSVAANTTSEQTFTVNGLLTSDVVVVNKPSHDTGLGIGGCRVSADNTLAITYINTTGSAIDPSSESYKVVAIRREKE